MKSTKIISIAELAITAIYVVLCTSVSGSLPHSMSCTSYLIPHELDFSLYILTVIAFVATTLFRHTDKKGRAMVWLMIIGLADVALSPHYHTSNAFLHYFGGILCCVASVIYVFHRCPKILYLWLPCFVVCLVWPRCHIMFQELTCMIEMVVLNFISDKKGLSPAHKEAEKMK